MVRRPSRRTTGTVLASGIILATGVLAGTASATGAPGGPNADSLRLTYSCRFPAGPQEVNVRVQADMPSATNVGQPIQLANVRTTLTIPHSAVTGFDAASTAGSDKLAMIITEGGRSVTAAWIGRMPPSTPVPAKGDLVLSAQGAVPSAAVSVPGIVSFTADTLALALNPRKVNGTPTHPAVVFVTCTPNQRQNVQLATVTVSSPASPAASPRPGAPRRGAIALSPLPGAHGGQKVEIPPGCGKFSFPLPGNPTLGCSYIAGFSNVNKLHGSGLIGPGLLNLAIGTRTVIKPPLLIVYAEGELYYHGKHELPPARNTFLAFGFMPVTATLELRELTPIKIKSVTVNLNRNPITVTSTAYLSLHLDDVSVNGEPLNVGPHCQTQTPIKLVLHGKGQNVPPAGYTLETGGPLNGRVTIPDFSGCGVGEDLDPLLSASISASNNYTLQTQGQICFPANPNPPVSVCPPPIPKPLRSVPPLPK
jgi:hypothetical protein